MLVTDRRRTACLLAVASLVIVAMQGPTPLARASDEPIYEPHVVVATLDTGTNPFHPSFRRDQTRHPSEFIEGYPTTAGSVDLTFGSTFMFSVNASRPALDRFKQKNWPYWIPGTNIIGTWSSPTDQIPIFDPAAQSGATHSHGASASSQIAGLDLGTSPDAYLVIMDRTDDPATNDKVYSANAAGLRWAADQPWIDIIHTNIQNVVPLAGNQVPTSSGYHEAVEYALSKGKLVVSAGGNFYAEATETSPHAGPAGVLVAGANDNCGYTSFSNPDPHVVMDGMGTVAAQPNGFGTTTFSGTSSASPMITGYAAQVLLDVRKTFSYTGGVRDGALVVVPEGDRPATGPLADGRFTAAELHEIVRKTADPNPHASRFDGGQGSDCIPQPAPLPVSFYPKMGYGEVSEHTYGEALDVALGRAAMPQRPAEDAFYQASEAARRAFWD